MRALSLFFVLLLTWVLLSGQFTYFHILAGVFSSLLVTVIAIRKRIVDPEGHPAHLLITTVSYWPWLLWQIAKANIDVIYRVWHPSLPISPRLFRVPKGTKTDLGTVIYANSITLTPGTVTVDVDKSRLLVHALSQESANDLKSGIMRRRVQRLEYPR